MPTKALPIEMSDLSKETYAPSKPLMITRHEIIQLMGEPAGTVDGFIRTQVDFPHRVAKGKWSRKAVMAFFQTKGMI